LADLGAAAANLAQPLSLLKVTAHVPGVHANDMSEAGEPDTLPVQL
jgi:hypothetical protein